MLNATSLLFGVPIDDLDLARAVDTIDEMVTRGRAQNRTHQIATINVDFMVNAFADPSLRRLLQDCELCLADGMPIVWGCWLAGVPVRCRVAGADLVPELAAAASERGWRIHFYGSAPGVAERAVELLTTRHPGAAITCSGGAFLEDVNEVDESELDEIASHDPDILCVALGNPKQERFIAAHRERLGVPVMIGIGGTLDMLTGLRNRAPAWAQRCGVEWVFRAAQEPRRLGPRYARDGAVFAPELISYIHRLLRHRNGPGLAVDGSSLGTDRVVITVQADAEATASERADAANSIVGGSDLVVAMGGGVPRPSELIGLMHLMRIARRCERSISVTGVDDRTRTALLALDVPPWMIDDTVAA